LLAGKLCSEYCKRLKIEGLSGSSPAFVISAVYNLTVDSHFIILPDKETAAYFFNDLENIFQEDKIPFNKKHVLFFPSSYSRNNDFESKDSNNVMLRTEVLNMLNNNKKKIIVVTYPEAIIERVISSDFFRDNTLRLKLEEKVSVEFIEEVLSEYEFDRVDFVVEPGQYAVRGGIIDVYSYSNENPFRIEFLADKIESIRTFSCSTQLSIDKLDHIKIVPDINNRKLGKRKVSIFENVPDNTKFWINDLVFAIEKLIIFYEKAKAADDITEVEKVETAEELFIDKDSFLKGLMDYSIIEFGSKFYLSNSEVLTYKTRPQPSFNKNFDILIADIKEHQKKAFETIIFSDSKSQSERVITIIDDLQKSRNEKPLFFDIINTSIHEGFIDEDLKLCNYTDHQIFDRYHRFRLKDSYSDKAAITLKEIYNLQPGDFVTHIDHGIGRYAGLEKVEVNGKVQEAIRLVYQNNDLLYVSIHSLHRISKYIGKEGQVPSLSRLGSNAWNNLKNKTKQRVKDIAKDLIKLYAERKTAKGFQFNPDTYMQHELEASFFYQDTPDQIKSTADVKKDMEAECPMDRLICGDVGFGKTEIAVRAAFKAVADSKQVAVLVPTTILALQHYKTFSDRLKEFPCKVDYINRFKSSAEQKKAVKDLEAGKTDILIGTHRLISKDVKFKDLGLLIIDEEQKFGVGVKEKLKQIKVNVDTLTLTATPIPRTLQFSLMGARDLSIINTAPPNRYPIKTEVHVFNEEVIRDAIMYEISRGGQVFFVHNRVQNIHDIAALLEKLCPGVRIAIGHGQLEGEKLEEIMLGFIDGNFDVLVSTTIVESGLDIPNANTIIINDAHNFGLSDLHQLRGRVGRTNKRAFCYLLSHPMSLLTAEARRRLRAIEEFSDLGSGFNIAMRDLDIRGAGNLLGGEQSGFISEIGFEMYHKILDEAIQELKDSDNSEYEAKEPKESDFIRDCQIDTDLEILIPEEYVSNISERLFLYKELDNSQSEEELLSFQDMLIDRFGPVPKQAFELMNTIRLRWIARDLGIEKIVLKNNIFIGFFITNPDSKFYQSGTFQGILNFLKLNPRAFNLKESNNKLQINIEKINKVQTLLELLGKISAFCKVFISENRL
jgi:transcription-repair coupling factor (superfamily II helicase)